MKAPPGDGQAHRQTDERKPAVPPPAPATVQNACLVQSHAQQHHRGRTEGQHGEVLGLQRHGTGNTDRHLVHPRSAHGRHLLGDGRTTRRPKLCEPSYFRLRPIRHRPPHHGIHRKQEQNARTRCNEQIARAPFAKEEQPHRANGIGDQNVPHPKEVGMQQSEDQKPPVSPHVKCPCRSSLPLYFIREQDHTRSEQQGKEAHEFLVGKELRNHQGDLIPAVQHPLRMGVEVVGLGQPEADDVHDENAQQCKAPHDIQLVDACGYRLHADSKVTPTLFPALSL